MQLKLKFFMILALLFTTMTAGAQMPLQLTLYPNYEGATEVVNIPVDYDFESGKYHYSLTNFTPTGDFIRDGHSIVGWAVSPSPMGDCQGYATYATVYMNGNLTLYAIWNDTSYYTLNYTITSESPRTVKLNGYDGNKPTGALVIPSSVTIGDNSYDVTSIGIGAFYYCTSLTSVTIPASVTSIGASVFDDCINLASINVDADNANYVSEDGVLFNKEKTTLVRYPMGKSGTSYDIPASVTSIGENAFTHCGGLTSVTIPASVTSIGSNAFRYCTFLTSVTINSNPCIFDSAFDNIAEGAMITMNLTGNEGKTDEYWMTFFNENYSFQVPATTQIFKASLSGTTLTLTKLADKIVTKDNAVILKSTTGPISLTLVSSGGSNDFSGNDLQRVNNPAGLTAGDPSTMFVLNKGANGVGFYRLAPGKTLGLGKAYLYYYDGGSTSNFFGMDEETTSISEELRVKSEKLNSFFDLSGRKVANPKKGIYIHNGKKVVIK